MTSRWHMSTWQLRRGVRNLRNRNRILAIENVRLQKHVEALERDNEERTERMEKETVDPRELVRHAAMSDGSWSRRLGRALEKALDESDRLQEQVEALDDLIEILEGDLPNKVKLAGAIGRVKSLAAQEEQE